ncbi:hypothetical protein LDENG_00276820 [Lucifuga dentata]|nr:hypothetical protein LDENG_00276820 [Lucifuga dentata]
MEERRHERKEEGRVLSKITSNSTPPFVQSRLLSPCLLMILGEALDPISTPSETLTDGHLLNSLLLRKKKSFLLLLSSVCRWSDELEHFKKEKEKTGSSE